MMRIAGVIPVNDREMVVCYGEGIYPGMHCSKIRVDGKTYDVISCFAKETLTQGIMAAYLEVEKGTDLPLGEVEIVA